MKNPHKFIKAVVMGFNKEGRINQVRQLSINVNNASCPIERQQVKRATQVLLGDEEIEEVLISVGKRMTGEFDCPEKADAWATRELFGD